MPTQSRANIRLYLEYRFTADLALMLIAVPPECATALEQCDSKRSPKNTAQEQWHTLRRGWRSFSSTCRRADARRH